MIKKRFISMLVLLAAVVSGAWAQTETLLITINSTSSFTSGSRTFNNIATVTFSSEVECDDDEDGWYNTGWSNKILSVTPAAGYTITKVKFYCERGSAFDETSPFEATLYADEMYVNGSSYGAAGVNKIEVYGYAAPATVAVNSVTLAPTSATLTLGETETVTLIPTVLPAEATDKSVTWSSSDEAVATVTDGVVTAVAAGTATITVTTTDGAKTATCAVTVAAPAASTYTATLKEGTEDATSWTIAPDEATTTGVAAGTEVKATYSGTKKVKSVKAVKKAAAPAYTMAAAATTSDKGKLICTAGHIHVYGEDAACTAGRVAKIIYVGPTGHATYNHGLALALEDMSTLLTWDNSGANNDGKTAAEWCSAWNTSKPVTDAEWLLASKDQWNYMLGTNGAGSSTTLLDGFTSVGGSNLESQDYWSSTEYESNTDEAWMFNFGYDWWYDTPKNRVYPLVRACLAF